MTLFNVYIMGHWIDEVLYLKCGGIEKTCADVKEYVHRMDTHPDTVTDISGWLDESFYTVMPSHMPERV
jgi:hypothetical protein